MPHALQGMLDGFTQAKLKVRGGRRQEAASCAPRTLRNHANATLDRTPQWTDWTNFIGSANTRLVDAWARVDEVCGTPRLDLAAASTSSQRPMAAWFHGTPCHAMPCARAWVTPPPPPQSRVLPAGRPPLFGLTDRVEL